MTEIFTITEENPANVLIYDKQHTKEYQLKKILFDYVDDCRLKFKVLYMESQLGKLSLIVYLQRYGPLKDKIKNGLFE